VLPQKEAEIDFRFPARRGPNADETPAKSERREVGGEISAANQIENAVDAGAAGQLLNALDEGRGDSVTAMLLSSPSERTFSSLATAREVP
jgi:hypothetical protein